MSRLHAKIVRTDSVPRLKLPIINCIDYTLLVASVIFIQHVQYFTKALLFSVLYGLLFFPVEQSPVSEVKRLEREKKH